jgi:hypothetical protein
MVRGGCRTSFNSIALARMIAITSTTVSFPANTKMDLAQRFPLVLFMIGLYSKEPRR